MCCLGQKIPFLLIGWALPLQISGSAVDEGELCGGQGLVGVPSSARNQHPTSEGAEEGEEEGREGRGRGVCGADLALHPIPTPCSLQHVVSWGAEPIKSELGLIALLMGKPHFSIDLGFCSPQRAASN